MMNKPYEKSIEPGIVHMKDCFEQMYESLLYDYILAKKAIVELEAENAYLKEMVKWVKGAPIPKPRRSDYE